MVFYVDKAITLRINIT